MEIFLLKRSGQNLTNLTIIVSILSQEFVVEEELSLTETLWDFRQMSSFPVCVIILAVSEHRKRKWKWLTPLYCKSFCSCIEHFNVCLSVSLLSVLFYIQITIVMFVEILLCLQVFL